MTTAIRTKILEGVLHAYYDKRIFHKKDMQNPRRRAYVARVLADSNVEVVADKTSDKLIITITITP